MCVFYEYLKSFGGDLMHENNFYNGELLLRCKKLIANISN